MTEQEIRGLILPRIKKLVRLEWQDDIRECNLLRFIQDGITYLDSLTPKPNDYVNVGRAQTLLDMFVMYAEAHAMDDFRLNYSEDLTQFKLDAERAEYAEHEKA